MMRREQNKSSFGEFSKIFSGGHSLLGEERGFERLGGFENQFVDFHIAARACAVNPTTHFSNDFFL